MNEESIDFRGFKYDEIESFFQEVFGFQKEPSKLLAEMICKSKQKKLFLQQMDSSNLWV